MVVVRSHDRVPSPKTLRKTWKKLERSGVDPIRKLREIGTPTERILLTYVEQGRQLRDAQADLSVTVGADGNLRGGGAEASDYERSLGAFFDVILMSNDFRTFAPKVREGAPIAKKRTYRPDFDSASAWFAYRHLESELRQEMHTRFSNRNSIVDLVSDSMSWSFNRTIVRADVKEFYENISHESLINRLEGDPSVSSSSVRAVYSLLESYKMVSGQTRGIPRGIGLSACISEYVLSRFDDTMRSRSDCLLYVRYVDDVYAVFGPRADPRRLKQEFREGLEPLGLELSSKAEKCRFEGADPSKTPAALEYLGYRFSFGRAPEVVLSSRRLDRMRERIEVAFRIYDGSKQSSWEKAMLLDRIRYLTSNTKLGGNKRDAYVGIRFSQPALNALDQLDELDALIQKESARLNDTSLQLKLQRLSCRSGFETSKFHTWTPRRMQGMSSIWREP